MTPTPRGGSEFAPYGISEGATEADLVGAAQDQSGQPEQDFSGLGSLLEDADEAVFRDTDAMIRRQELLALNRWNIDEYYKCVVDGYPWATLIHDTTRDTYTFELPYGVSALSIQPVPNKNLDLVNKTGEQLLVDFPEADAQPIDDSEEAEQAADYADRFLTQDAGEQGTNDAVLFDDRVKLSLITASSFIEYWTDPSGGGYVPLQIEAHPEAVSPDNPLVGPDGMPTTDYVLRYVTAPQGGEFTDDPSQAAPQWQPRIRTSKWAREHIRTYPEHLPVELSDEVIVLGHSTIGEGKKRWPALAQMSDSDLSALCDWAPPRYLVLLPPFQRARWKLSDAKTLNKGGNSDERIFFYYHRYVKARPDYPKGADVVMSGLKGGLILDKKILSVDVPVRKGTQRVTETRCREIPIVQITPRQDPTGQDPMGKAYVNLFVGATEANSVLSQNFAHILQKILTTPFASTATSPISGEDVENARATGGFLTVVRPEDMPQQLTPPVVPSSFFEMYNLSDEAINSIANRERAASGDLEGAKERSGKAIQLAVGQNSIGNNSMLTAVNNSYARGSRIKLEISMADFTTAQQVAYVGEDGANKMDDFRATDFALIGKVSIKTGTGTGLSQDGKVQYLGNLKAAEFIPLDEAKESARPIFAKRLGLPANPFEQYVSRAVDAWLDGPPESDSTPDPMTGQPKPAWAQQYQAWMQAQNAYTQAQQQYQQQLQAFQQYQENKAIAAGGPPQPLGPEGQNAQAMDSYQRASIALQVAAASGQALDVMPQPPQPPQIPKPWTPFDPARPIDTQPDVAAIWTRRLGRVISSSDWEKFGPEWADVINRAYTNARQAVALAGATQSQHAATASPHGRPSQQQPAQQAPSPPSPPNAPPTAAQRAA